MAALWAKSGTIVGPDGEQYQRGGTNAANGNVFYGFAGPTATQTAGTGATLDAAWFQYAFAQYPEGGLFLVGPTKSGHENGVYFASDLTTYCEVPGNNITVWASRNAQFRIADNKTTARVFQINGRTDFQWSGGTFTKIGAVNIDAQSFFLVIGASHSFTLRDAKFLVQSTSTALKNFYCVSITGPSSNVFLNTLLFPEVSDCEARFSSSQQATAYDTPLLGSSFLHQNNYGGGFLKLFNTRGAKVRGLRLYGDEGAATTRFCGPLIFSDNEEALDLSDVMVWGLSTVAADGTLNDLMLFGRHQQVSEGSHFQFDRIKVHTCECRFAIHLAGPLYCELDNLTFGRVQALNMVYAERPPDDATPVGFVNIDNVEAHNCNSFSASASPLTTAIYGEPGDYDEFNTACVLRFDRIDKGFNLGRVTATYFVNNRKILHVGPGTALYRFDTREWMISTQAAATVIDHPVQFSPGAGLPTYSFNQRQSLGLRPHRDVPT